MAPTTFVTTTRPAWGSPQVCLGFLVQDLEAEQDVAAVDEAADRAAHEARVRAAVLHAGEEATRQRHRADQDVGDDLFQASANPVTSTNTIVTATAPTICSTAVRSSKAGGSGIAAPA